MRALVVYESMFGNTKLIAEAIAEGLSNYLPTEIHPVAAAPVELDPEIALVAVGGPTHAFGMSRPATRADAAKQGGAAGPVDVGIRDWLQRMHADPAVTGFATFGTKVGLPIPGSAARSADRTLRDRGFHVSRPAASFRVQGTPGPLRAGETDRARRWGAELGIIAKSHPARRDEQSMG
jgi:hypothetical protein